MALIRSRQALVGSRTQLVDHVRGSVKSFGARLPKCPARSFHNKVPEHIPEALMPALGPVLEQISSLTERIRYYDRKLEEISKESYPERPLTACREPFGAETGRLRADRCTALYQAVATRNAATTGEFLVHEPSRNGTSR